MTRPPATDGPNADGPNADGVAGAAAPAAAVRRPGVRVWLAGARPRTLPVALVPVLVGTAAGTGTHLGGISWWRAAAALVVSLGIQIGTNYGNDYSDGIRGTDAVRVGPVRLVAQRLAPPRAVLVAALLSFAVAAAAGLALAAATSWWLVAVGAASVLAGWYYTGGRRPYGYAGLGEVFVLVFFGLVATAGSAYVQSGHLTGRAVAAAVPVGLLAVALLVVNNLRDIPTDRATGKRTLAVRIGDRATRWLYLGCLLGPFPLAALLAVTRPWALITLVALPLTVGPGTRVWDGEAGRDLVRSLQDTARVQLAAGVLLALGLAL